jgi:hypothetical protein
VLLPLLPLLPLPLSLLLLLLLLLLLRGHGPTLPSLALALPSQHCCPQAFSPDKHVSFVCLCVQMYFHL